MPERAALELTEAVTKIFMTGDLALYMRVSYRAPFYQN